MILRLPYDSNLVSGISMFIFNFFFFTAIHLLSRSICASTNLIRIYDQRLPLSLRRSRLAVFGGPVGHVPIVRVLSVLIAVYALAVIVLDFSINGSSETREVETQYRSVVRAHPHNRPLRIDYAREYRDDGGGAVFASRRLVALAEAHACMVLNFTHHIMFGYAFPNLDLDTALVPMSEMIPGGECVRKGKFRDEILTHQFAQSPLPTIQCLLENAKVTATYNNGSVVGKGTITRADDCDIKFLDIQCYKSQKQHCAFLGTWQGVNRIMLLLYMSDSSAPNKHDVYELRGFADMPPEERAILAANIAFFAGAGFPWGVFNLMYMSLNYVEYNKTLVRIRRLNVSEIEMNAVLPVLIITVGMMASLALVAGSLWVRFVYMKGRTRYHTFSTVNEILQAAEGKGLRKTRVRKPGQRCILLHEDEPVLSSGHIGM